MANKISLAIRYNKTAFEKGKLTRPYLVSVPRSMNGGVRGSRSFATRDEARKWANDFAKGVIDGGADEARELAPTVSEKWDEYYNVASIPKRKDPNGKKDKRDRNKQDLDYFGPKIKAGLGPIPMNRLSVPDIEKWLAKMRKEKSWSDRTAFNAFAKVRTFLRWAKRRKYITEEPAELLAEEIKKPASKKITITALEMRILLKCSRRDPLMRSFLVFGGFAGLRTIEIQNMAWETCDWDSFEIHVPEIAIKSTEDRGGMAERYVKMLPAFAANIPRHLEGEILPVSRRVFESRRQDMKARAVKVMERVQRRWGVKFDLKKWTDWPDNCLRHTFASCLLANSKNASMVSHEMGHTNLKTLKRDYARAVKEKEASAYFGLAVKFLAHGEPKKGAPSNIVSLAA